MGLGEKTGWNGINSFKRVEHDPSDWFGKEEVDKAKRYLKPLRITGRIHSYIDLVVTVVIVASGFLVATVGEAGERGWFTRLALIIAVTSVISVVIGLPFGIWSTFVHEEKWGFNTQKPLGFIKDLVLGTVIGFVIGVLITGGLWYFIRTSDLWWVWGWGFIILFSIGLGTIAPVLLDPLFNKFKPIEDAELNSRILEVAKDAGLKIKGVFEMDGSKRSKKDNAYVSGLGKTRRVVVFDTMLQRRSHPELATVIAHEFGHWRLGHIKRNIALAAPMLLIQMFVLKLILENRSVLDFFGAAELGDPIMVPIFGVVFGLISTPVALVTAAHSRACEREADLEALRLTQDPESFRSMMRGAMTDNLDDLAPTKWKYLKRSHPPGAERLQLSKDWEQRGASV